MVKAPAKSISRDDIVDDIAGEFSYPKVKLKEIILSLEDIIVDDLRTKSRVRVNDFGTFYIRDRKSRMIKSVSTKRNKLLLERREIKFYASDGFRASLNGVHSVDKAKIVEKPRPEQKVEVLNVKSQIKVAPPTHYRETIKLPPLKYKPPADKERVKKAIQEKILALASRNIPQMPEQTAKLATSAENAFRALYRQALVADQRSIDFSYDPTREGPIDIYCGRPRKRIGSLPKKTVYDYLLLVADLEEFHIPQQRFTKLVVEGKMNKRISLDLHSFPTDAGVAIHIKIYD
jgi:nucleoid DNA-binding protein